MPFGTSFGSRLLDTEQIQYGLPFRIRQLPCLVVLFPDQTVKDPQAIDEKRHLPILLIAGFEFGRLEGGSLPQHPSHQTRFKRFVPYRFQSLFRKIFHVRVLRFLSSSFDTFDSHAAQ